MRRAKLPFGGFCPSVVGGSFLIVGPLDMKAMRDKSKLVRHWAASINPTVVLKKGRIFWLTDHNHFKWILVAKVFRGEEMNWRVAKDVRNRQAGIYEDLAA